MGVFLFAYATMKIGPMYCTTRASLSRDDEMVDIIKSISLGIGMVTLGYKIDSISLSGTGSEIPGEAGIVV
jgi:hypothetical protein